MLRELRHIKNEVTGAAIRAQRVQWRTERGSQCQQVQRSSANRAQDSSEPQSRHTSVFSLPFGKDNSSASVPNTVRLRQRTAQAAQRLRQGQLENPNRGSPTARATRGSIAVMASPQHAAPLTSAPPSRAHLVAQLKGGLLERRQGPLDRRPEDRFHECLQGPIWHEEMRPSLVP